MTVVYTKQDHAILSGDFQYVHNPHNLRNLQYRSIHMGRSIMITSLSDEELVRSVEQNLPEQNTPLELELLKRLDALTRVESAEEVHKYYERALEQSEFRRQIIEDIRDNAPARYRKVIDRMLDESYVEL